jgi:DNA-binding GntR family transcriptional regulator
LAEKAADARIPVAEELDGVNSQMESALAADDLAGWAKADERFHQLLVERSGNRRLARMFHTIMDQSHRARMLTLRLRPRPTASVHEHPATLEAIRLGDPQLARERAKQHRAAARDQILPLLASIGLRHL